MAKTKVLTLSGLNIFWRKIKEKFEPRISAIETDISSAAAELDKIVGTGTGE